MKITIYELLGLKKDGKPPKKFKFDNYIFTYDKDVNNWFNENRDVLSTYCDVETCLNCEVEILEEDKWDYTMRQISKMIASGDLKDIYEKYLSNCPIGFMKEEDIYNYILKNVEVGTIEELTYGLSWDGSCLEGIEEALRNFSRVIFMNKEKINHLIKAVNYLLDKEEK